MQKYEKSLCSCCLKKKHLLLCSHKHIAVKYHHFRQKVNDGIVSIHSIDTKERLADIFTKPLEESIYLYLRKKHFFPGLGKNNDVNRLITKTNLIHTGKLHSYHKQRLKDAFSEGNKERKEWRK